MTNNTELQFELIEVNVAEGETPVVRAISREAFELLGKFTDAEIVIGKKRYTIVNDGEFVLNTDRNSFAIAIEFSDSDEENEEGEGD